MNTKKKNAKLLDMNSDLSKKTYHASVDLVTRVCTEYPHPVPEKYAEIETFANALAEDMGKLYHIHPSEILATSTLLMQSILQQERSAHEGVETDKSELKEILEDKKAPLIILP